MKRLLPFLLIYVLVHASDGDSIRAYEGLDQTTITALLTVEGKTGDFLTKSQVDAYKLAHPVADLSTADRLLERQAITIQQAKTAMTTGGDGNAEVVRAVVLTIIDEINLLRQRDRDRSADVAASTSLTDLKTRWAAEAALNDRTPAQAKTAVQTKIDSGQAN